MHQLRLNSLLTSRSLKNVQLLNSIHNTALTSRAISFNSTSRRQKTKVAASFSGFSGFDTFKRALFSKSSMSSTQPIATEKWWDSSTVAVVTGGNKGIGFEVCRILAEQGLKTVVTARDPVAGADAAESIKAKTNSDNVLFHQLDITDQASVEAFADWAESNLKTITILINNAGFAYKGSTFGAKEARVTLDTNFVGTARVCRVLLDRKGLISNGARIVNVCSSAGKLSIVASPVIKQRFIDAKSYEDVAQLADEFVAAIAAGTHQQQGWPNTMYGMSKLCESISSKILAEQLKDQHIAVIPCNPGYTNTSMTSFRGTQSPAEGADTPCWLALQPPSEIKKFSGRFYTCGRQEQPF